MTQTGIVKILEVFDKSKLVDMKQVIKAFTVTRRLAYKRYKFLSGPFKGAEFISNAPDVNWMNRYPNFDIIFISGKLKGIKTMSLQTYDQKIEEKTVQWLKLL